MKIYIIAALALALIASSCRTFTAFGNPDEELLVINSYGDVKAAARLRNIGIKFQNEETKCSELTLLRIAELQHFDMRELLPLLTAGYTNTATHRKHFFYKEAFKLNTNSPEAIYGLSVTSSGPESRLWLQHWKSIDRSNGLPFFFCAAHLINESRSNAFRQLEIGNSLSGIIHRPLYERLRDKLTEHQLRQAEAEWRTSPDHTGLQLTRLHYALATNVVDRSNTLNILLFDNNVSSSTPKTAIDAILGCTLGNRLLRSPEMSTALSEGEIQSELKIRTDIIRQLRPEKLSADTLGDAIRILEKDSEGIRTSMH